MATLDVLDYAVRLDEALVPLLPPGERKLAVREARRVVEDLAFRFALIDGRVMPEEIDYARALEAVKAPPGAAPVLARRRPVYRRKRTRKRVITLGVLTFLALVGTAFAQLVASEEATVLVDNWRVGGGAPRTASESREFTVPSEATRIQFTASVVVLKDKEERRENTITLVILDPVGTVRYEKAFTSSNAVYAKGAIEAPTPGTWTVFVDFRDAAGSAEVSILAVSPR